MKNRFITALVSVGLVLTMSVTVAATPLDELNSKKNGLIQKQNENSSQLGSLNKQINDLESSIESYDNQISGMTVKLNDTKSKISNTQAKIQKAEKDLQKAQDDFNAQQKLLDQRIKVIYVNGSESYLSFLLDSKGIGDFISRIETVKQVSELDKQVMADLEEQQKQIKEQKQTLDTQKTQLVKLQADQQKTIDGLNKQKSQEKAVVAQYNNKKAKLLSSDSQYRAQIQAANQAINEEEQRLAALARTTDVSSDPSEGPVTDDGSLGAKIVAYAYRFKGLPYLWGGNGPYSFDCSGFTKYVYAHFGIVIPRTSETQAYVGTKVSKSQLQQGDLVFFMDSTGDIHHVGIYVGGGCFIHAPKTGDVIKISSLDRTDFIFGRHIR